MDVMQSGSQGFEEAKAAKSKEKVAPKQVTEIQ